jgi:hypothetical protein
MARPFASKKTLESTKYEYMEDLVQVVIQFAIEKAERNTDREYIVALATEFCAGQDRIRKALDRFWRDRPVHGEIVIYDFHPSDTCLNENCFCRQ